MSTRPELVVFIYFLIHILLLGESPVAMRLDYAELATFWPGVLRFGLRALILALASVITGEFWPIPIQPGTWLVMVYLVFFVSSVAFLLYLEVLNRSTVSTTSYGFVITPFVTAVISAILLNEQIIPNFLIGLSIVVAGVMVGALWQQKEKEAVKCVTC